ncbi:MAG: MerR family transcriptional regulator [Clostridia bacterium]|nr:MerR family transcriptional regulator [Clostridia bacterium]
MIGVKEVSNITGLTVRTIQYYDRIGLVKAKHNEKGYRFYDEKDLARFQEIMLFRELEFSLEEIEKILSSDGYIKEKALTQQINLLTLKKQHLEDVIRLAKKMKKQETLDFKAFNTEKIDEYAKKAKEKWGNTPQYKEYEKKEKRNAIEQAEEMMVLFEEFGKMKELAPSDGKVQAQVKKLQDHITQNYYNCTKEMLSNLGMMYVHDEEFRKNIDIAGGEGTAKFVAEAIMIYST